VHKVENGKQEATCRLPYSTPSIDRRQSWEGIEKKNTEEMIKREEKEKGGKGRIESRGGRGKEKQGAGTTTWMGGGKSVNH